jgi:hypothetical protein
MTDHHTLEKIIEAIVGLPPRNLSAEHENESRRN